MYCISITYRKAELSERERFAFSTVEREEFLKTVVKAESVQACVLLSTCNRSEIYFEGEQGCLARMEEHIARFKGKELSEVRKYDRIYQGEKAVRHLFRVTAGLDSMVLGEDEILGQVKEAYQYSLEQGYTSKQINLFFQSSMACAKAIKTDTRLSKTSVSTATLAASHLLYFTGGKGTILLMGITGQIGNLIAKNLASKKDMKILATTRRHGAIQENKKQFPNVELVSFEERYRYLNQVDVIISATSSPHYTLTGTEYRAAVNAGKKQLILDMAVPTDVDSAIGEFEGVTLHNIDYFAELAKMNREMKLEEVQLAEDILEERLDETLRISLFEEFYPKLPDVREGLAGKSLEEMLYCIRDNSTSAELKTVLEILERISGR